MPELDGWSFLEEFAKLPKRIKDSPVYIFSAYEPIQFKLAIEPLVKGIIRKPVDLNHLLSIVKRHCN